MTDIAVIGPGAIGASFAAALRGTGRHEVVLCGRRPSGPIEVEDEHGTVAVLDPPLVDPSAVGQVPWVVLAVKTYQTAGTVPWLERLCGPGTSVVVLQNGVEQHSQVGPLVGEATVLPGIVWSPTEPAGPGRVRVRGTSKVTVPDVKEGVTFAELLEGSRVEVDLAGDFTTTAWAKLCVNAVGSLMALVGKPAVVFGREDVQELAVALAEECVAVARAEGARLEDGHAEKVVATYAAMPPDRGTSILYDRLQGRQLEWDARNGVVCRLGAEHGIATPVSRLVTTLLAAADNPEA